MSSPFFNSKYLDRKIYLSELEGMEAKDIASLRSELKIAISSMQQKMHEERDEAESDWLYSISLKIKICEQFLEHIDEFKGFDSSKLNHYHLLYFRQKVSNLLGPLQAQQLFDQARLGALGQLKKEANS